MNIFSEKKNRIDLYKKLFLLLVAIWFIFIFFALPRSQLGKHIEIYFYDLMNKQFPKQSFSEDIVLIKFDISKITNEYVQKKKIVPFERLQSESVKKIFASSPKLVIVSLINQPYKNSIILFEKQPNLFIFQSLLDTNKYVIMANKYLSDNITVPPFYCANMPLERDDGLPHALEFISTVRALRIGKFDYLNPENIGTEKLIKLIKNRDVYDVFSKHLTTVFDPTKNDKLLINYAVNYPKVIDYDELLSPTFDIKRLANKIVYFYEEENGAYRAFYTMKSHMPTPDKDYSNTTIVTEIWPYIINSIVTETFVRPVSPLLIHLLSIFMVFLCHVIMRKFKFIWGTYLIVLSNIFLWVISLLVLGVAHYWISLPTVFLFQIGIYFVYSLEYVNREIDEILVVNEEHKNSLKLSAIKGGFIKLFSDNLLYASNGLYENSYKIFKHFTSPSKIIENALNQLQTSASEFHLYLHELLQLSNIEKTKRKSEFQFVNLLEVIQRIIDRETALIRSKNIKIINHLYPSLVVFSNRYLLEEILTNLFTNSVKYTSENSQVTWSVSFYKKNFIQIHISDEGQGIPSEYKDKVFEKFYRIKNNEIYKNKGTGLGLYMVRFFSDFINGYVYFKNNDDKGCTFTLLIPCKKSWLNFLKINIYKRKIV